MRLKLMSSDMIESCVKRTRAAFEVKLQRSSRGTDFRVPQSICTMFNVMVDARVQSAKLCAVDLGQERQYHSQIDNLIEETVREMTTLLVAKFVVILESVLAKISRYDEGTLFSSFLSFTVKAASKYVDVPKPGMDVADGYVTFVRHSQDMLREKVNEEVYVERLFDRCCAYASPEEKRSTPGSSSAGEQLLSVWISSPRGSTRPPKVSVVLSPPPLCFSRLCPLCAASAFTRLP
uniref:MUN domain-containing protein n=1 Tax=Knipowitschia caucasica TaxID=637954 RepID=A0AAV2M8Y9_KNICA